MFVPPLLSFGLYKRKSAGHCAWPSARHPPPQRLLPRDSHVRTHTYTRAFDPSTGTCARTMQGLAIPMPHPTPSHTRTCTVHTAIQSLTHTQGLFTHASSPPNTYTHTRMQGLAIHVSPPSCLLGPWSRTVLQISCFNDMCGDYHDTLHIQVGTRHVWGLPCGTATCVGTTTQYGDVWGLPGGLVMCGGYDAESQCVVATMTRHTFRRALGSTAREVAHTHARASTRTRAHTCVHSCKHISKHALVPMHLPASGQAARPG